MYDVAMWPTTISCGIFDCVRVVDERDCMAKDVLSGLCVRMRRVFVPGQTRMEIILKFARIASRQLGFSITIGCVSVHSVCRPVTYSWEGGS